MTHTPKQAKMINNIAKALRKSSKTHAKQADQLDSVDETSLFEAKGKHAAKRFRMMIRKGIKPDASTARKAAKYNMKNKGMGFDETDAEMRSDEATPEPGTPEYRKMMLLRVEKKKKGGKPITKVDKNRLKSQMPKAMGPEGPVK